MTAFTSGSDRIGNTAADLAEGRALAGLRLRAPSGFDVVMDPTRHHLTSPPPSAV